MKQHPLSFLPSMRQVLAIAGLLLASSRGANAWVVPAISSSRPTTSTRLPLCRQNANSNVNNNGDLPPPVSAVQDWMESSLQCGRTLAATASLAGVLFLSPTNFLSSSPAHQQLWHPPASWAAEPSLLLADAQQQDGTVFDEVWTLIDKYFIDRTHGGQDWKQVKEKYQERVAKAGTDDGKLMKLTTEMTASLGDKYSRMLDAGQYAAIQKFDLIGVGVTLMPNQNKEIIVGSPPVPKSASDVAGLRVGDKVVAINGVSTTGRTAFDIIDQIAENPNAESVTMTIKRDDTKPEDAIMPRAFQQVKDPIRYKISETRSDGTKVGFVRILEFNALVKTKLQDALAKLEEEGANAYVIDLRMNTGGAFQSAVEISSLFMQDRVATYVVDSSGAEIPFKTTKSKLAVDKEDPLVIWIDGSSASASEVLAGALHDNCRAAIMGDKSFGKGLIQAVYGLQNGGGLVLTVARYVTPGGHEIQGIGITPDITGGVPFLFPGLSTDTSKVDFKDISTRLGPSMCAVPDAKS